MKPDKQIRLMGILRYMLKRVVEIVWNLYHCVHQNRQYNIVFEVDILVVSSFPMDLNIFISH